MSGIRIAMKGLEGLARANARREKDIANGAANAVKAGAQKIDRTAFELVTKPFVRYPQFRNVQDAPRRLRLKPMRNWVQVRFDLGKCEARILARAHTTTVTPAVRSVAAKTGQAGTLRRRGLWVTQGRRTGSHFGGGSKKRSHRAHESRAGLRRISFSRGPAWFAPWAAGKGLEERDTVRLKGEMLRRIVLKPAVDKHKDYILAQIKKAVERAL